LLSILTIPFSLLFRRAYRPRRRLAYERKENKERLSLPRQEPNALFSSRQPRRSGSASARAARSLLFARYSTALSVKVVKNPYHDGE
jgi:hypothetical protein